MPYLFNKYYPLRGLLFFAGESLLIFSTFSLVQYLLFGHFLHFYYLESHLVQAAFITIIFQLSLYFYDLYDLSRNVSLTETATKMTQAFGLSCILLAVSYYSLPTLSTSIRIFWAGYFTTCGGILVWRWAYYFILNKRLFSRNVLVLGTESFASSIAEEIEGTHDSAYKIVHFIGDTEVAFNPNQVPISKRIPNLANYCRSNDIELIVIALDDRRKNTPTKELLTCKLNGIKVKQGADFYEEITGKLLVERVDPSGIFFSDGFRLGRWTRMLKRCLDITFAIAGIIISLPISLISACLIKFESPGPIFYLQKRVGQRGKIFQVIKFRSMYIDAEQNGAVWAAKNDDRATRFGAIMRKTRIDEIPQMWNVLRGEMSTVGPRPERPVFVEELTEKIPYYTIRHYIQPGITGWAQVSYPYGSSVKDALRKLEYDLYYMKNISFFMDLMIIFKTVKTVLFSKGAH